MALKRATDLNVISAFAFVCKIVITVQFNNVLQKKMNLTVDGFTERYRNTVNSKQEIQSFIKTVTCKYQMINLYFTLTTPTRTVNGI